MRKLFFIDNTAHHLFTQRHLYDSFAADGYSITLCCPDDGDYFKKLTQHGYTCLPLKIHGKSKNLFYNLILICKLYKAIKKISPDIIFSFTIKPNIFCAMVGRWLKIPVVPNITGLGTIFLKHNFVTTIVIKLYKFAFFHLDHVVFQNQDDKKVFIDMKMLSSHTKLVQVPGSGVNLNKFPFVGYNNTNNEAITFLYIGRLLWDKGIAELISAFKVVKKQYPETQLKFIGNYFIGNPSAIRPNQMEAWLRDPGIEYLGMVDHVDAIISTSDCVVLPSYREGMPRAILEGSSMGKPVITTDTIGCKDALNDGETGFLCKVRDADDLTKAMLRFIKLPLAHKQQMGIAGRKKMECEFDQKIVVAKYREILA